MASSSIIATITTIITIIVSIIIIIIIMVHHRRRCRKSIIRSGKSLNERFPAYGEEEKNALYLSTKVLVEGHYFTSPTGDQTIIFRGHPSYAMD